MLIWDVVTRRKFVWFQAQTEAKYDTRALKDDLVEALQKFLDELDGRTNESEWDIVIQFVTQSGYFIITPIEVTTCEVDDATFSVMLKVNAWNEAYHALPDSNEDENAFQSAYVQLHQAQVKALEAAINDVRVRPRFEGLKQRMSFAVYSVDEGDTPIKDRMEFLWGNQPPKREFATAKELFEHILNRAGHAPRYSMRLDGEKVIAVDWFGHEFTDRFVDLMDEVSNLATICCDLQEIFLTASRVTQSGVERLKTMLPETKFIVVSDQEFVSGINPWRG